MTKPRRCKECPETSTRPAPHPGPRCATHHRAWKKRTSQKVHETRVQATYGLAPGDYERLYQGQGGRCAICQWATGKRKRLAVDHDHTTGLARGLLCGPCNLMIGRLRAEGLQRAYWYLVDPPAPRILNRAV